MATGPGCWIEMKSRKARWRFISTSRRFEFKPGQTADLTLLDPPETDPEGIIRTFSIASAPFENRLMFVTRMRDTAFKRSLKKVPLGTEVQMSSAMGSFTLHRNAAKPAVFLAGGIGITPFFSIRTEEFAGY